MTDTQDEARWQVNSVRHEAYSGNSYEKPARVTNVPFFSHPVHGRLTLDYLNTLERDKADLLAALVKLDTYLDFSVPVKAGRDEGFNFVDPTAFNEAMAEARDLLIREKEETR